MEFISLYELNKQVKQALKERFEGTIWITAEIASVQENRSGHCYLELVDKPAEEEKVTAIAKGTIWAFTYRMLKPYFETTTGRRLEKGMKVLLNVEVVFHEVYGFSLNIKDIDPTFTLGDLERKKREILEQLERDGIIDMNRNLELPPLPKTIAVISSPTAAGLGDFRNQLEHNSYGYRFHIKLFPAVMQGEQTVESVIAALDRIYAYENLFDVVVLIRGGGAQSDLGCFDSYELAANIAQFPLPVIAGIGHERDDTVVDRVAYLKVKTPTAAAAFLIETFQHAEVLLEELRMDFLTGVEELLKEENKRLLLQIKDFKRLTQTLLQNRGTSLQLLSRRLEHHSKVFIYNRLSGFDRIRDRLSHRLDFIFDREKHKSVQYLAEVRRKCENRLAGDSHFLELAETKVKYVDPKNVLERGYSITRLKGKAVKSVAEVSANDILETILKDGKLESEVRSYPSPKE